MNKNGFTLVEMIAAIIVILIIASIPFAIVNRQIEEAKHNTYLEQIDLYKRKAQEWVLLNGRKEDNPFVLTLKELVDAKLLEEGKLINPKTKDNLVEIGACIFVEYVEDNKTFTYTYSEECVK